MFGGKLFAATFGMMLVSNYAEATNDFKDLNLPMLEKSDWRDCRICLLFTQCFIVCSNKIFRNA